MQMPQSAQRLELLLRMLNEAGLQTEVRHGDESTLLVFARATKSSLKRAVYQSRYVPIFLIHLMIC